MVAAIGSVVGFRLTHGGAGMSGNFEAVRMKQATVMSDSDIVQLRHRLRKEIKSDSKDSLVETGRKRDQLKLSFAHK